MTATPNLPPMQSAFEAWASDNGAWPKAVERDTSGYRLMQTESSWIAWQAAYQAGRDAGLEEAAATVDVYYKELDSDDPANDLDTYANGQLNALDVAEQRIRALKSDAKGGV